MDLRVCIIQKKHSSNSWSRRSTLPSYIMEALSVIFRNLFSFLGKLNLFQYSLGVKDENSAGVSVGSTKMSSILSTSVEACAFLSSTASVLS